MEVQKRALQYDFSTIVGGHATRLGDRSDVELSIEFASDLYKTAVSALSSLTPVDFAKANAARARDKWDLHNECEKAVVDRCYNELLPRWQGRLADTPTYLRDKFSAFAGPSAHRIMKIGIIGAGNVGTGLSKQLVKNAHAIMLSFTKDPAKLKSAADLLGTKSGTPAEAAAFGDVVVLATPWTATAEALRQVGKVSGNKILWDCTNVLKPDMSGLLIGTTTSGGEEVAKLAPWAKVVKAIPPFAEVLHASSALIGGCRPGVFVRGDDATARKVVVGLEEDVGGAPIDAGALTLSRYVEPAGMLLVQLAHMQGFGAHIGLTLLRDTVQSAPAVARGT